MAAKVCSCSEKDGKLRSRKMYLPVLLRIARPRRVVQKRIRLADEVDHMFVRDLVQQGSYELKRVQTRSNLVIGRIERCVLGTCRAVTD